MAAWRLVVRALYELGPATSCAVSLHAGGGFNEHRALYVALTYGLVHSPGRNAQIPLWCLTQLGVDWCEGRVTQIEVRPGGRRWVSTWLSALPRGLRLDTKF